jgi:hypothetical protein
VLAGFARSWRRLRDGVDELLASSGEAAGESP